jgi:hypothetical protein
MEIVLIPLLGVALLCVGFGPLTRKKNPAASIGFLLIGFAVRLAGLLLLAWTAVIALFVLSMAGVI